MPPRFMPKSLQNGAWIIPAHLVKINYLTGTKLLFNLKKGANTLL